MVVGLKEGREERGEEGGEGWVPAMVGDLFNALMKGEVLFYETIS